jgi:hypothetical protein
MLTIRKSILSTVGAGVAASLLLVSGMAEAQQRSNPQRGSFELAAPQGPQPGDCKAQYVQGFGQYPAIAEAVWSQSVASGLGNNWAIWAGAKNKSVIPVAGPNGTTQFRAMAQPCFYHPVP